MASAGQEAVLHLMQQLEPELAHVRQVARLAMQVFDLLQPLHHCGGRERFWLESAAFLHDIGWSAAPDGKKHHKESARLIREHLGRATDAPDVELIALIARYHRKSTPSLEHADFAALPESERLLVEKLAGMLRIADGLDRSHLARVETISARIFPDRIRFELQGVPPLDQEIAAAQKKGDLARKVFGRKTVFVVKQARVSQA